MSEIWSEQTEREENYCDDDMGGEAVSQTVSGPIEQSMSAVRGGVGSSEGWDALRAAYGDYTSWGP